jgi:hydroxyethylthiazole kinase-like uncharacterized protein yjeF
MKLVTADRMRQLEQKADQSGNTFSLMMERAGKAVADALRARLAAGETRENHILVLVGPGNNGGDGLVCARDLYDGGAPVTLYLWKRTLRPDDANLQLCMERDIPVTRAEEDSGFAALKALLIQNDVIVDALLGTGVTRPIEGLLKELLGVVKENMGQSRKSDQQELFPSLAIAPRPAPFVVAVDLPSGLNPDTGALDPATLPADLTVTFAFPKVGQLLAPGADAVGNLVVADIGIPAEWANDITLEVAGVEDIAARLPRRSRESHKGTFGKAMICAGSLHYIGAAYLAGTAATRAGAGLVTLALARTIQPMVAAAAHETTFLPLPDDGGALIPAAADVLAQGLAGYDALLFGPGFGRNPQTIEFVRRLLDTPALPPRVVDADALYALSQSGEWWTRQTPNQMILTPHPGEMATLCGEAASAVQSDRLGIARKYAQQWQQVVVLKGARTVIAAPDGHATILPFATPALATAGTGDVLAGTVAALLAQGLAPFDAAVVGGYLHGLAGEIAQREIGVAGAVAGDLLPRLPQAIKMVQGSG